MKIHKEHKNDETSIKALFESIFFVIQALMAETSDVGPRSSEDQASEIPNFEQ